MIPHVSNSTPVLLTASLAALGLACAPAPDGEDIDEIGPTQMLELAEPSAATPLVPDELDVEDVGPACSLEARPAAVVNVFASVGSTVQQLAADAAVFYRHYSREDGWSEVHEAYCSNPTCSVASLGHGQPGTYLVGALGCGDLAMTEIEVGETRDGCHVATQYVPLVLDEAEPACFAQADFGTDPLEPVGDELEPIETAAFPTDTVLAREECPITFPNPSVIAMTGIRQGDLVWPWTPEFITSQHHSEDEAEPMACLNEECTNFMDGWGETGSFELDAQICGKQVTRTVEVLPSDDGCNVDTRWVYLGVDASECAGNIQ